MTTEQHLDRLEKKLDLLLKEKSKVTWVNGHVVSSLTGWSPEKMRQMREQGVMRFKKVGNTVKYQLESIPEIFLKAII